MATRGADVMAGEGLRVMDPFQFEAGSLPQKSNMEWEGIAETLMCALFLINLTWVSGVTS